MTPCEAWPGRHRASDGRPMSGDRYAYRVKYEAEVGPIPEGYVLHHECEHPWCVNVDHLTPVPRDEHLRTHGLHGDRHQAAKTHCPAGHPYDETNTYRPPNRGNERQCRACMRIKKRERRAMRAVA